MAMCDRQDGDGLLERPLCPGFVGDGGDTDEDGWGNACDNCEFVVNPDQTDTDLVVWVTVVI